MEEKPKKQLMDFLTKPLVKSDSKFVQYSGLGVQLSGTILIFLFIGIWLDRHFGTKFIFTLILTFVGFFGGFYSFYLSIKNLTEQEKKSRSQNSEFRSQNSEFRSQNSEVSSEKPEKRAD